MTAERQLEGYLIDRVKKKKGKAIKMTGFYARGWPDRLILLPNGRAGFAEVKASHGKASLGQLRKVMMLRELGFEAEVVNSREQIDGLILRIERSK